MKRVVVCSVFLALIALIAHFCSDVAVLDSNGIAARSVAGVEQLLADIDREVHLGTVASTLLGKFLLPGAYLASRFGIDPITRFGLGVATISSWWMWITAARLAWCFIARVFGLADMGNFWIWLLFVPPWRPVYRNWLTIRRWYRHFFFHKGASARWTGFLATLTLVYKPTDRVFLGRPLLWGIPLFQQIGIRGRLHVMVIAASGAGKTRWLVSWLGRLLRHTSGLIVDCDAEIVNALGWVLKRLGRRVFNLDPFSLSRFEKASWNALDELTRAAMRHGRQAVIRFAETLAECLVAQDNSQQPIFATVARQFLLGLILFVWLFEPAENRHLVRVRELAARGLVERVIDPKQDAFAVLIHAMKTSVEYDDGCDGAITAVIARAAAAMESGQRAREGNPFRTSLLAATAFLDIPEIAAISKRSDFSCEDLKLGETSVFISAPVIDVQTKLSGWVRTLTMMSWYTFANIEKRRKTASIFVVDEMPSLRIESLDTAAPVARKHDIQLVLIAQDLEKMRQTYPRSYLGFVGNAMATIWMGTDHPENLKQLSDTLGTCLYKERIEGGWLSKIRARYQLIEQKLAHPHQLRELLDPVRGWMIVTRFGKPPMLLAIESPEAALPVWSLDPNPAFGERLCRRIGRLLWNAFRRQREKSRK